MDAEESTYVLTEDGSEGVVVRLCGRLSMRTAELLLEVVDHEDPRAGLTIELGEATFANARALRVLIDELETRRRRGWRIHVQGSCIEIARLVADATDAGHRPPRP